jgi:Tfp pilus assembly protein PilX
MSGPRRARRLLSAQHGFTMVSVMFTMLSLGVFAVGAWTVANGDIPVARADQDHKRAYEAAQAGLQWYAYELDRDPTYWTKCATVPAISPTQPAPVNLEWNGTGTDPRTWRPIDVANTARYTVEILDKRDKTGNHIASCSTSDAVGTALQDNTLRIRATGKANGETRSLIATFKRRSFMDFVYFTNSEAQDPLVGGGTDANCSKQRSAGRSGCTEITFIGGDQVKGPLHSNDSSLLLTGSPITFGRVGYQDAFEIAASGTGTTGGGSAVFNGPKILPAPTMDPPPGNTALRTLATPAWTFTGHTCLTFKSNKTVDVRVNQDFKTPGRVNCDQGTATNRPLTGPGSPPNGVIYVQNSPSLGCSDTYKKYNAYSNSMNCGDVSVEGQYAASITVGAENDIIVRQNLLEQDGSDSMLGLVAAGFVRIYHPISGITSATASSCGTPNSTPAGFTRVSEVDAAILSLKHSFMVDNYACASPEGNLKVVGAIAQWYRGVVGTGSPVATGYVKDYNYDDRLKVREPPNFLDPVKTSWRIVRQTEQKPAVG